ncbi:Gfo/Idh/MocA family oxidoreductase [Pseudomonas mosselii]|uniref:Gfo/Idh/MocA family protein n=1 Tax=Pseudomonas mosselii TaxID=78327 RepID=UPI000BB47725|nr:Gfo/Idh/MocA family oxidoreductase [Pseudomonas mosselii]ATB64085.1 oxidoreductase [Pseudomonas mosselii]MDH1099537.1 Gfo/Idh/MocA family oxidoreductase [Pseudomonas mosselii]
MSHIMDSVEAKGLSSNKLKVGFLGGGFDSAVGRAHRAAIELDQRFELVCGSFSRSAQVSRESASHYRVDPDRAYDSLEVLLEREASGLDAVVIMTPQDQHAHQVLKCLDANLPVICEKSLVGSVEEAQEIATRLQGTQGFLAVIYNYTGYPILRELRAMISSGRLGKIRQLHIEMPQEGFARVTPDGSAVRPQAWRLRDGHIPTLSLDLGVHIHMMIRFLTGETPLELVATHNSYGNFSEVIDNVSCIANYTNGVTCNIWYGKSALGSRNGLKLRVLGELGSAEWVQEYPEYLNVADNQGNRMTVDRASSGISVANQVRYTRFKAGHPTGFVEAMANYYHDIADALEANRNGDKAYRSEYVFGVAESIEGLKMLSAISKSSSRHQWERM